MSSAENNQRMNNIVKQLSDLNLDAAFKTNLGDVSLGPALSSRIGKIREKVNVATHFVDDVNRLEVIPLADEVNGLAEKLGQMTGIEPATFIQNRAGLLNDVSGRLDRIEVALRPFALAEQRKKLDEMLGVEELDVAKTRENIRAEAQAMLANVKKEADSVLAEARKQAAEIQGTARDTATGVTVVQAQVHFADLISTFRRDAIISAIGAIIGFVAFMAYVFWLLNHEPNLLNVPQAIFAGAVRVTLLASLAAVVTFTLKIFRANLHMYYHTLHRQQLTNSIQSFVDAARTDEHRDAVLMRLVDAVSTFGSSGLIGASDDMPNTAKIIIDALPKMLGKPAG